MITHLDLFSGIGGFALAAQWAGFTTVGFCEIDPYAQRVLQKNFGAVMADAECVQSERRRESGDMAKESSAVEREARQREWSRNATEYRRAVINADIFTLRGSDYIGVDLITGGFPCQPYSVSGKRRGAEDDRALWPEMLRVIKEARPAWVVGENVAGIINMELDRVLSDLETLGYAARPFVIPACAVDAKHRRDRVWIVGYAEGEFIKRSERNGDTRGRAGPSNASQDVADADLQRSQGRNSEELPERGRQCAAWESGSHCFWTNEDEWFAESGMGRVANGIPNRVHRLRSLGNAIVPQVAYPILRAIYNDLTA